MALRARLTTTMDTRFCLPCPDPEIHVPDLRTLPLTERRALSTGPVVKLYDGVLYAMQLPRKLFLAATLNSRLIDDDSNIRLPPDTGLDAIRSIGSYLLALTTTPGTFRLRCKNDFEADLRILKAARLLDVESYVTHIHAWYWWKLTNKPIDAGRVQIVLNVALDSEDPFVRLIGDKIATLIRDGTQEQADKLRAYVEGQPYLRSIVAREDKRHCMLKNIEFHKSEPDARRQQRKASKDQIFTETNVAAAKQKTPEENHIQFAKAQGKSVGWAEKRRQESELVRSLQEKMRLGRKVAVLTRAEARHYERTKGKRCPYKIRD